MPTVFAYFRTRGDLVKGVLDEVVRYYTEMFGVYARPEVSAPRALLNLAIGYAASVDSRQDYARVMLEWSSAVREEIWPAYLEQHAFFVGRIREIIVRGQREGDIDRALDAENAALMIIGSAQLVVQMKFTQVPPAKLHRFLLALLRGAIGAQPVAEALD